MIKDTLYFKFLEFIEQNKLINPGEKILAAVSGGIDSMVLLNILIKMKNKYNLEIGVAHVNYKLRGIESDLDEKLVKTFCKINGIQLYVKKLNTKLLQKEQKSSIQVIARNERYKYFEELSKKYDYDKIAIAHNMNDNAETVLLNLFRGAGNEGIKGIVKKRGNIIRPLIFAQRKEITRYAKEQKIEYRQDISNLSDHYNRNFLRNKIIPEVEKKINPSVIKNIYNFSEIFEDFSEFFNNYLDNLIKEIISYKNAEEICLDIIKINDYINYIRKNIIKKIIFDNFKKEISKSKVDSILDLLSKQTGRKVLINKEIFCVKDRNNLIIRKNLNYISGTVENTFYDESKFEVLISDVNKEQISFGSSKLIEFVDKDKISGKILIRKWHEGDFFYPIGLKFRKKISDFLTNIKINVLKRDKILVLEENGNIIWICGYRLDDRYKINSETKNIFKLEIRKKDNG